MKYLNDLDLSGKVALVRVNLNVPLQEGIIQDDYRIRTVLPTIDYVKKNARKTVLIAHLGRPGGKRVEELSLQPVADYLENLYKEDFHFLNDSIGDQIKTFIDTSADGAVILLENLRFNKGERDNDEKFGKALAQLGDVYINDAFGDCAKENASVMWPPKLLPSAAGFRIKEEIEELTRLRENPEHPYVVIIGGAKIKEKMSVIKALGEKADTVVLAGALANTMLAAGGVDVKDSLQNEKEYDLANELVETLGDKLVLPSDVIVAKKRAGTFDPTSVRNVGVEELEDGESILDIGEETFQVYKDECENAQMVFWAGTLGYIEWPPSAKRSIQLAAFLGALPNFTGVGGGETAEVLKMAEVENDIDFVATGGGAALSYLAGEDLPGLKALG